EGVVDHHVRVLVNGVAVGEVRFDGKEPNAFTAELPAGVLKEADNTLTLDNVGDTGVYSMVFLDRFEVSYAQAATLRAGRFEGTWADSGAASISGGVPAAALDVTDPLRPAWLASYQVDPNALRLEVTAGHRYLVASPTGLFQPRVAPALQSSLRDATNQADYILVAPAA